MASLENITEKSFFQKIKNSFFSKLIPVISAATFAFAGCGNNNEECKSSFDTFCTEGVTYHVDSCGNLDDIKEYCNCGCTPDHANCNNPCCGDGEVDIPEECDGNELKGNTCQSLGFDEGILRCTNNCELDLTDCHNNDEPLPSVTTKTIGGIPVSSGKTNSEGHIVFKEGNEDIDIYVKNENNQLISDAQVTYFDGSNFECFQVNHVNYAPHLECFAHNSSHTLSLTSSFQTINHDSYGNEHSITAAGNYADWAESNWEYLGCRNQTQLKSMMKGGSFLVKLYLKMFTLGFLDNYVDAAYNSLEGELEEDDAAHVYLFNPSQHGMYGTSTIWTMDFKKITAENCYDNIDNDCDGLIDAQDSDCQEPTCTDECSYQQKECVGNSRKECGNFDSDECLEWSALHPCNYDEHCESGACFSSCIPSTEICNGADDNCNGEIDENLIQACYTACGNGLEWCIDGTWQNCNAPRPSTEICDGIDNDCDDQTDEGCSCINGQNRQCGTTDLGECEYGTQTCSDGEWGNCIGVIYPASEICDTLDNDCDGNTDNGNLCSGSDCLEGICCYPNDHLVCDYNQNHYSWLTGLGLYWTDACGRMSDELAENCPDGCTCSENENGMRECTCHYPTCFDPDNDNYGPNCTAGSDCDNHNSNIHPGADEVLNGLDDDCDGQIDEGFVNTGDPQVTAHWDTTADLDLHVYAPDGCHLYYGNTDCGTGHLDRDANKACQSGAETPPENIYWDVNQAPNGTYRVEVDYYKDCNSGPTAYTVSVSKNGSVTTYSGTLNNEGDNNIVTSFDK